MHGYTGRFITRIRMAVVMAAALAGVAGGLAAWAVAAPASQASTTAAGSVTAGTVAGAKTTASFGINKAAAKTILLLNGDRLVVTGKSTAIALAGGGFNAALTELRLSGREYVIPDVALPFLGHGLDLSLFDIAAQPGGSTLNLRVSYTGKTPRLPGVTITHAASGVATGYLTAAGARTFGAALARQFAADHGRASYGSDGIFAGGVYISEASGRAVVSPTAGLSPQAPRSPQFALHTVTIRGVTQAGKADTGDLVFLFNATNNALYGDPYEETSVFYHGTAKFSVPTGKYWAFAWFTTMTKKGVETSLRAVLLPRITISGNATVTMRAAAATSELAFVTPVKTTVLTSVVQFIVIDPHGNGSGFGLAAGPGMPEYFSPTTQKIAAGKMTEFVNAWLTAPAAGPAAADTAPDLYSGVFQNTTGLVVPQRFAMPASALATVHAVYASGTQAGAGVELQGFTTTELDTTGTIGLIAPVTVPARVTEHLTAAGVYWANGYYQSLKALGGGQTDVIRTFAPGSVATQDWNVYPLNTPTDSAPAVNVPGADGFFDTPLSATRVGNSLTLNMNPFTDDTAGHTGSGFAQGLFASIGSIGGSYQITDNGTKVQSGKILPTALFGSFDDQVNLPAAASTVGFTLSAQRTGALFPLSTAVSDTWTWTSVSEPAITVPVGWFCADGSPTCAVQPLLTFGYQVAGIALDGTAAPGAQTVALTVGHQALTLTPPAVTSVSAAYSVNGGTTWLPATVTGSGGSWSVAFNAPAGSYVSLRVSAADAAGGTLTETVTRAFATQTEVAFARAHAAHATLDALVRPDSTGPASVSPGAPSTTVPSTTVPSSPGSVHGYRMACAAPGIGQAQCYALWAAEPGGPVRTSAAGTTAGAPPAGLGAKDIEHAYKLPVGRNSHATVAVVEAYNTPQLETYLNVYRKQYGLTPCTTANGCFRKVGQNGSATHLPASSVQTGWDLEATLDVDMVSAACPSCRILVVEANGQNMSQLAAATDTAVRLGAVVVSNSYGNRESGQVQTYAKAWDHPGHTIVVASGDFGYTAASFPANLATVTAVGGTQLAKAANKRGWSESVWNTPGAGAGGSACSAYVSKPSWQHDKSCPGRTVVDVSAVAWNVAVYEKDYGGWGLVGGTSAASPIIAGIYGLAGNAATVKPGYEYAHTSALFDVRSGNNDWFFEQNGAACGGSYLCVAKKGYDAPTGLGSPDGIGAF